MLVSPLRGVLVGLTALAVSSVFVIACVAEDAARSGSATADGGAPGTGAGTEEGGSVPGGEGGVAADAGDAATTAPPFEAVLVTAGTSHTCALAAAGEVFCWGSNAFGQLGVPAAVASRSSRPLKVELGEAAKSIAAGGTHTCAVTTSGKVKCWGNNEKGQLGRGTLVATGSVGDVSVPDDAPALARWTKAVEVSAGDARTCVTTGEESFNGQSVYSVFCWGENGSRQLSTNRNNGAPVPAPVLVTLDASETVGQGIIGRGLLQGGSDFACAPMYVVAGAAAFKTMGCWGNGVLGQLGGSSAVEGRAGFFPRTAGSPLVEVMFGAAGRTHACARVDQPSSTKEIYCWGNDTIGQAGAAAPGVLPVTALKGVVAANVSLIAAGGDSTCLVEDGKLRCLGKNDRGQLGRGTTDADGHPALSDVTIATGASSVAIGEGHVCAVLGGAAGQKGRVHCWGSNAQGQLGDGLDLATGYAGAEALKFTRTLPVAVAVPK